jgi:hypothetical protein
LRNIPRVLICAPTSVRHKHLIDEWLTHLDSLDHANIDVCLVDTTPDSDEYFNYIRNKKVKGREIICWRRPWLPEKEYALQMLANVREDIRQYFVQNKGYDYLYWLDDDIFIPKWGIQRLLSYNKDLVGFYVHVYYKPIRRPCVFKSGEIILGKGLEYYTFKEIAWYKSFAKKFEANKLTNEEKSMIPFVIKDKWHPYLFPTYAVNLGCMMCSRKVSEAIPFRTHPTFLMGEDLWWYAECNDKKFTFWCDSKTRPVHKNTVWTPINDLDLRFKGKSGIYIMQGPENAEGVVFMEHNKEFSRGKNDKEKL